MLIPIEELVINDTRIIFYNYIDDKYSFLLQKNEQR